jgi:glycosyltransferase involved in cell wall biosynthesis
MPRSASFTTPRFYLSTSLGEGWGLGVTEALAAGLPVAVPRHTSCLEIQNGLEQRGMGDRVLP